MLRLARLIAFSTLCLFVCSAASAIPPQASSAASHSHTQKEAVSNHPAKTDNGETDNDQPIVQADIHNASLWHDPGNIAAKDLYFGQGGQQSQPQPPFTFISEDRNGTNPKFDARDANGTKWRVKLGAEAQPEIAASRLLWAVGYYVDDDYVLHLATIQGLKMQRGNGEIHNGNQIVDARFSRKPDDERKIAIWQWKKNPFRDTRQFNGLRVMMAVMNSWDLKDVNNAVYLDKKTGRQYFLVRDIGSTFATNAIALSHAKDKGNPHSYKDSNFITKITATTVNFGTPAPPTGLLLKTGGLLAKSYFTRRGYDWIGDNIPREDARWIGSLLGQLSHRQLVDAFRAAHFSPQAIDTYVQVLESRIAQLKAL